MIDFSLKTGACNKFLENLFSEGIAYNPEIIRRYPFFNYLLRSGTPNNIQYGKFGILLSIFTGIIKKLDISLVQYFDAFFYQLLKELDFTSDGLTIKKMEINEFKSFLGIFYEISGNKNIKVLSDNLSIGTSKDHSTDSLEILLDIEMLLCHVIIKYNVEQIIRKMSVVSRINIYEINKILFVKYFPRTLMLLKDLESIPEDFLINSPMRMYHYNKTMLDLCEDNDIKRILTLELMIFKTKFFLQKKYWGSCEPELLREKINHNNSDQSIRVNDTVSVLYDYYATDVDLEYWTGSKVADRQEITDVMVYYDYLNGKVRHQAYTDEISRVLLFFRNSEHRKDDYIIHQRDKLRAQSLVNELFYKSILL